MKALLIFSVKDNATQSFSNPLYAPTQPAAVRLFGDAVNDGQNQMWSKHPADYELYSLGLFDPDTGKLIPHKDGPEFVVRGVDLKREE